MNREFEQRKKYAEDIVLSVFFSLHETISDIRLNREERMYLYGRYASFYDIILENGDKIELKLRLPLGSGDFNAAYENTVVYITCQKDVTYSFEYSSFDEAREELISIFNQISNNVLEQHKKSPQQRA